MTKQISLTAFTFDELSPEVQQKLIDKNRDINVQDSWWYESELEYYKDQLKEKGIICKDINFELDRGRYMSLDKPEIENINLVINHFLQDDFLIAEVGGLIDNQDLYFVINNYDKGYHNYDTEFYFRIDESTEEMDKFLADVCNKMDENLHQQFGAWLRELDKSLEYNYSDEAVKETLQAQEWLYLENGKRLPVELQSE